MNKSRFRPRLHRKSKTPLLSWVDILCGSSRWLIQPENTAVVHTAQRAALTKVARRLTKKAGLLQVNLFRGHPLTGKPLGVRMGKGKGKIITHRNWFRRDQPFLVFVGGASTVNKLKLLQKRCSAQLVVTPSYY